MIPFWPLKSSEIQWPGGAGHRYEQSVLWAFPVVSRAGSSCPGLTACAWPLEAPVLLAVGPEDWPRPWRGEAPCSQRDSAESLLLLLPTGLCDLLGLPELCLHL